MTAHYTSIKNMRENIIFKSKFNLELFKTLVWNFAHIHSKSRKLGMFIFFQKIRHQFANFLHFLFSHVTCHVIINVKAQENIKIYVGEKTKLFICSEHIFDPGLKPLE